MSLAVVVVGRVGQFSSNTTNTLLENLMSCLMKNVKHDLPTDSTILRSLSLF